MKERGEPPEKDLVTYWENPLNDYYHHLRLRIQIRKERLSLNDIFVALQNVSGL